MGNAQGGTIRVGIGGWTYAPWRSTFYPEGHPHKRELEYASRRLTSIEINGTYYRTQTADTFAKWYEETPDDFVFAVKAPRFATNRKVLADAGESIARFVASGLLELKHKLGPINWQFMPTKKLDPVDFEAFLSLLPGTAGGLALRHAVEVRHESFRTSDFVAMATRRGVAVVIAADSGHPLLADVTAPFVYVRLMGTREGEALGYPAADLKLWAKRARVWAAGGRPEGLLPVSRSPAAADKRDVYLYVISGSKVSNPDAAISLQQRVNARRQRERPTQPRE
ncbi:MAG: DUF72 domain-containing protein [Candidatus Binatia bacterium]